MLGSCVRAAAGHTRRVCTNECSLPAGRLSHVHPAAGCLPPPVLCDLQWDMLPLLQVQQIDLNSFTGGCKEAYRVTRRVPLPVRTLLVRR